VEPGVSAAFDPRVEAVLAEYHWRIAHERARPPADRGERLLAVGPETGRLLNILARSLPGAHILELGTSFGYSTIWLAEAARAVGGRVTTMEIAPHKAEHARATAERAGLAEVIDFRIGDAVTLLAELPAGIDFVLVDLWKDLYLPCLEAFHGKLNPGAIVVSDNMLRPGGANVEAYARALRALPDLASVRVPVGNGLEISVRAA
jgi:predicted O-methyltransferase YrrM